MSLTRAFVALEMPEPMQRELHKLALPIQRQMKDLPLRWVQIPNIHLTLKFLGPVSPEQIAQIGPRLQALAAQTPPLPVHIAAVGAFPNAVQPRVLWAGLETPPELHDLQASLERELVALGFPAEPHPFRPHLTLARVRREHRPANIKRISEMLAEAKVNPPQSIALDSLALFSSDLKPGGSVYTPLVRSALVGN